VRGFWIISRQMDRSFREITQIQRTITGLVVQDSVAT
jgi:hypothetical protein